MKALPAFRQARHFAKGHESVRGMLWGAKACAAMQGQTLAACSAGTAGAAPYLQYAVTEDDHLVVTGGSQGGQSSGKFSRHRLRLPKAWGSLQVEPCHGSLKLALLH